MENYEAYSRGRGSRDHRRDSISPPGPSRKRLRTAPPAAPPLHDGEHLSGDGSPESYQSRPPPPGIRFRQPARSINWHVELCYFFGLPLDSTDDTLLTCLDMAGAKLEEADRYAALAPEARDMTPRYESIHRVACSADGGLYLYLEEPFVVKSGPRNAHLRGSDPITNFELYLERNKSLSFIAYKDYRCCAESRSRRRKDDKAADMDPSMLLTDESVSIISQDLCTSFESLAAEALLGMPHPVFEIESEFPSPYFWWFHRREKIAEASQYFPHYQREHLAIFQKYVEDCLGEQWAAVDSLLAQGMISTEYIGYLFCPNTILVARSDNERIGQHQAYMANDWLQVPKSDGIFGPAAGLSQISQPQDFSGWIDGVCWTFDGNFQKMRTTLTIDCVPSMKDPFSIRELMLYPIKFAEPGLEDALRERGAMYWKCRERNYVCYSGEFNDGFQTTSDSRYMIDIATYKQMHPPDPKKAPPATNTDELGSDITSQEKPPVADDFLLCLPQTIPGFNMNKKEWTNLDVSRIKEMEWNEEAFKSLVVDEETKELISALVTNQIDAEKSTDLMSGKGNGLFILLHGGPGTGKTLTAESVAEFSKKPLYRVTCGDIGTEAAEVEKYLEVVMLLGKTWGCVVLLDEADVFLEQRKISDLQRNALVSVFLRVLEYYDGILILTSNRVGTFDEAFKSRIQLTLRYKNLGREQRLRIWGNFISRLESFQKEEPKHSSKTRHVASIHGGVDLGINAEEVRANLDELAETELNGREIRNAVSTARQLAMFRREQMGYSHLRVAIAEAEKFEKYLLDLNKGFTRDELMQDKRERLKE